MALKLTRLTHKIAIQLYLVAVSYTICGSRSRRSVRKLLDTPSYVYTYVFTNNGLWSAMWTHRPSIQWIPVALLLGIKWPDVKMATHLHLVPRLRIPGVIPPLSKYVFTARCLI